MAQINRVGLGRNLTAAEVDNNFLEALAATAVVAATAATKADATATTAALAAKQATLVSATNIKTVNGVTLLGAGDLVVATPFTGGTLTSAINNAPIVTLASAATVAIGAAAGNAISITGITTITAFDSIASGALRQLTFAGALTWTHNAVSMILPSGANIVTAAGDSAWVASLGAGNWRALDFSRASGAPLVASPMAYAALTDKTTVDLPAVNTPLAAALASKGDVLATVALTIATTLARAAHGNRQITFTGADAIGTVSTDTVGLWTGDDTIELHTLAGSAGNMTLVFPDGKTITGSPLTIVGGTRKGTDSWTVGTTRANPAESDGDANAGYWLPSGGAGSLSTASAIGVGIQTALDSSAATTAAVSSGNVVFDARSGVGFASAAAAINRVAGFYLLGSSISPADTSPQPGGGRFPVVMRGAIADAGAACTFAMGLSTDIPPTFTTVEPSTRTQCIMVAADTTDTNFQVMHNDGTATCTKVDTGFPVAQWVQLKLKIEKIGAGTSYRVTVTNRETGVVFRAVLISKLPSVSVKYNPFIARSSMANVATVKVISGPMSMGAA